MCDCECRTKCAAFSSGSLDLLTQLPDGRGVEHPLDALAELAIQSPQHPYSRIGKEKVSELALLAEQQLQAAGVELLVQRNRITIELHR